MKAKTNAQTVLDENFITQPPIHIVELAKNYGYDVLMANLPPDVAGMVYEKRKAILINNKDSTQRQAFTIAHELGHIKLHPDELAADPNLGVLYRIPLGHKDSDPKEQEANCFAANLLVPDKMLKALVEQYNKLATVERLARVFGVSTDVIRYRLKDLRLHNG